MEDIFSTVECIQYIRRIISAMGGYYKYYGEILSVIERYSVLMRVIISTVESTVFSTVEYPPSTLLKISLRSTHDMPLRTDGIPPPY